VSLDDSVRGLLHAALRVYADSQRAMSWLSEYLRRLDEPVRVAVAGPPASGKSTLVNALIGDRITPVGDRVFTWYRAGTTPRAVAIAQHGGIHELAVSRHADGAHVEVTSLPVPELDRIEVHWPTRTLRDLTIIDTPCNASLARVYAEADAVLYLMRGRQGRELLRCAFDNPIAAATPVNTIAVLPRTDEIGAGRIDALTSGRRLVRRLGRDLELSSICQDVVAVAGLIAQAGRTLCEAEFTAMAALAGAPADELSGALLSADRFVQTELSVGLGSDIRQALLDRLGVFGVRLVTTLIRTGFDDLTRLAAELVQRSGLGELRESMRQFFLERSEVLKARSALLAVDAVLRAEPRPEAAGLVADLERVLASAHEFRELRLLSSLQPGRPALFGELDAEARRIVGGGGTGLLERLGIDREPSGTELQHLVQDALGRWQEQAGNVQLSDDARRAARIVVRSCEGMLAALYDGVLESRGEGTDAQAGAHPSTRLGLTR
jgi:energy-coupling factor transporter ATP-binding protein EcfA2